MLIHGLNKTKTEDTDEIVLDVINNKLNIEMYQVSIDRSCRLGKRKVPGQKVPSIRKKHSLSEVIKLNETFNLCDIWRVHNPHKKLFTFQQKHFTGVIQRRLDYIFAFNSLQNQLKRQKF